MMYPRLRLARNLLQEDGVIFVSIDDNELANLRKLCDEVFGEENFVATVIWERAFSPVNLKKHFSENHDYAICYAKQLDLAICNGLKRDQKADNRYTNPDNDPRGPWMADNMTVGPAVTDKLYEIVTPGGRKVIPPNGRCWVVTEGKFNTLVEENRIWFGRDGNNVPRLKKFLSEVKQSITPLTIWPYAEVGHSQEAQQALKRLFDGKDFFDYPKSVRLIQRMVELYSDTDSIVLDFFAGSATTAQAVMQENVADGGQRRFIMVQLPEPTEPTSEAFQSGYKNIAEIAKKRLRRAANQIREQNLGYEGDLGFRVFKLDSSNIRTWEPDRENLEQTILDYEDHIKPDRTEADILYELLLKLGLDLCVPIEQKEIAGKPVHSVGGGVLVTCLAGSIGQDEAEPLALGIVAWHSELSPAGETTCIFRDSAFQDDVAKTNLTAILEQHGITNVRSL